MLIKIPSDKIFRGDFGWHTGRFHFSFGDYQGPNNLRFGDLLTFNDFELKPGSGFDTHSHREIEIISYCVDGELMHEDNMGNTTSLQRGDMQYTCAGSGIFHSERNPSPTSNLRFIQIWIQPEEEKLPPEYFPRHFDRQDRLNRLLHIASGQKLENVIRIKQDANIFISELEPGSQIQMEHFPGRQVYLANLEGSLRINDLSLQPGDAVKIRDETTLNLVAVEACHFLVVEMAARDQERPNPPG